MTKAEVTKLLTFISAWDKRTIGEMDVAAWHLAATASRWTPSRARRAVETLLVSGTPGVWLTPAHVSQHISAARREVSQRLFTRDIEPPRELEGDVAAEMQWRRVIVPAVVDRYLDAWADSGELPTPTNELDPSSSDGQARLAALIGNFAALPA